MWTNCVKDLSYCGKLIDFERLLTSKRTETFDSWLCLENGTIVAHDRHTIFTCDVLFQRADIFKHFIGLSFE